MSILRNWRFGSGCLISLICLWLALRNVPLSELIRLIAAADPAWIAGAIGMQLLAVIARSWRWIALLGAKNRLEDSFWAQGIGYLFTNIFPLRLGEPARVIVMAERCNLPVMRVAATAVVERLLDVATIVLALVIVLPLMPVPQLVGRAGFSFGLIVLGAVAVLLIAVRFEEPSERLLRWICRGVPFLPAESIIARWKELVGGFAYMTVGTTAAGAVIWSIMTWAFSIASYFCVIRAYEAGGNWLEATFMIVTLSFAVAVPSSPGFIGVFQLAGQQALVVPFGAKYSNASALTITITGHLIYYLLTTALGSVGLWKLGASLARLGRMVRAGGGE